MAPGGTGWAPGTRGWSVLRRGRTVPRTPCVWCRWNLTNSSQLRAQTQRKKEKKKKCLSKIWEIRVGFCFVVIQGILNSSPGRGCLPAGLSPRRSLFLRVLRMGRSGCRSWSEPWEPLPHGSWSFSLRISQVILQVLDQSVQKQSPLPHRGFPK